ncbi:Ig-like domain-containing protein [Nannocystis bainbridge]|uniref:Ig-like domain-containing protein n=1 Tax=Nannocystis bainbridge TaxID=2995303 RepID=A0ABT5DQK6_9BACT|nr:Ig-like domain-containing protein [Nannocystis bainbridge]MDC0715879.1 Ig-like domain-containing protein [Nannocystis bainbridge]
MILPFAAFRSQSVAVAAGVCLLTPSAFAAPFVQPTAAPEAPEPAAWRATPMVPPAQDGLDLADRTRATAAGHAQANVFFLNYDGVTLQQGGQDNSATNTTVFAEFAANFQPYGAGNKRTASLQAVKSDWAPYDVTITDVRPGGGLYTMCVNSPTNVFGGGVLGVAPLDCNDNMAANIVLAFHSANDQFSAATQATTMSQEIAHAYGLEHVNQPNDIMNPYNAGGDPSFLDQCLNLDGGGNPIQCGAQHNQFCNNGQQNSHQELLWLFGSATPDAAPPSVTITNPKNGDQFVAPATITITAEANDNIGVAEVNLFIDGANQGVPDSTPPYQWSDAAFPEGTYCVAAQAIDDEPNSTMSAEVCFSVVKQNEGTTTGPSSTSGEPDPTTGEPPTTGGETGGLETGEPEPEPEPGSDSGDDGGLLPSSDSSALPPGFGQDGGDTGCGCAQPARPGAAGLLVLVALGLVRRRRRG